MTVKKGKIMKDKKRALRRHAGRMKYHRRLRLHLTGYDYLRLPSDFYNEHEKLRNPSLNTVLNSEYESIFYRLKSMSTQCSCEMCRGERHKRVKYKVKLQILKDIQDEGCSDRVSPFYELPDGEGLSR